MFDQHTIEFWQFLAALLAQRLTTLYRFAGQPTDVELPLELFKSGIEMTVLLTPNAVKLTDVRHTPVGQVVGTLADLPVTGRSV